VKVAALLLVGACGFSKLPKLTGGGSGGDDAPAIRDAPVDVTMIPDSGICPSIITTECVTPDTVRVCEQAGSNAVDYVCPFGCILPADNFSRCADIVPFSGSADHTDTNSFELATLADVTFSGATTINGDDGSITNVRGPGGGTINGTTYVKMPGAQAIFRMKSLMITGPVTVVGVSSITIIVDGPLVVSNVIDDRDCGSVNSPGGWDGGAVNASGAGLGGGGAGSGQGGAGGAGFGAHGGLGGTSGGGAGGIASTIGALDGGPGGGGATVQGATGGHGGGAIQLISNSTLTIGAGAGINAGGCGGHAATSGGGGGGGGGAGGLIVLQAKAVHITGALAVNGGGGAGGGTGAGNGFDGALGRNTAAGGVSTDGAAGGAGGAAQTGVGGPGTTGAQFGGGGGGGVGWILVNTLSGSATIDANAVLSPGPNDPMTTFSQGPTLIR